MSRKLCSVYSFPAPSLSCLFSIPHISAISNSFQYNTTCIYIYVSINCRTSLTISLCCVSMSSGGLCSSVTRRGLPVPPNLTGWLGQFNNWSQQEKLTALDSLIDVCDLNQVSASWQLFICNLLLNARQTFELLLYFYVAVLYHN